VIVASAVIGFTLWLSAINETAMANSENIHEMKQDEREQTSILRGIDRRTSRIEGLIEAMMPRKNKGK
jgi:hypothetical protein